MTEVLIAGGGPSGLALAILLRQGGHGVKVLEARDSVGGHSRAIGIHPPGLAVLDRLGVGAQAAAGGVQIRRGVGISRGHVVASLSFDAIPAEHRHVLSLPQNQTLALLRERLRLLDPAALCPGTELTSYAVHPGFLEVHATGPDGARENLECRFLVGADGTHSTVRRLAGIPLHGGPLPDSYLMGDYPDETEFGPVAALFLHREGITESFPLPGAMRRWVCWVPEAEGAGLPALIGRRTGHRVQAQRNAMLSRFRAANRAVDSMARGNVVLIGDAAHEVSPIGGQGMTLGLLDAHQLAPILDAALAAGPGGAGTAELLGAYSARRLAAARRAARQAHLNMALGRPLWNPAAAARDALARGLFGSARFSAAVAATFTMTRPAAGGR